MLLCRNHLRLLQTILILSLCARADSIPADPESGLKQSVLVQRPYLARIASVELVYDSAIARQTRIVQPAARVFFVYEGRAGVGDTLRVRNVFEWLFTVIAKIVLPSHGKNRGKR